MGESVNSKVGCAIFFGGEGPSLLNVLMSIFFSRLKMGWADGIALVFYGTFIF